MGKCRIEAMRGLLTDEFVGLTMLTVLTALSLQLSVVVLLL